MYECRNTKHTIRWKRMLMSDMPIVSPSPNQFTMIQHLWKPIVILWRFKLLRWHWLIFNYVDHWQTNKNPLQRYLKVNIVHDRIPIDQIRPMNEEFQKKIKDVSLLCNRHCWSLSRSNKTNRTASVNRWKTDQMITVKRQYKSTKSGHCSFFFLVSFVFACRHIE